ncbi:histidine phosphatase family protein [Calidifontibacter terrae]
MRLILVRHGETPANVAGSLDTTLPGPGLTDTGREQAAAVPAALAAEGIDAVFVSRAVRTHETAAPLVSALGLAPTVLDGAHEVQAGDLEKKTDADSVHTYLTTMAQWTGGNLDLAVPGGETGAQALGRFDESVRVIEATGARTAVLFSHGAMIRLWASARCANVRDGGFHKDALPNTGIVVLQGSSSGEWTAVRWLDHALAGSGPDDPDPYDGPTGQPFEQS